LPEVITDTFVFMNPSRDVVTLDMLLTGIISVPLLPFLKPVARNDMPKVSAPAVSFPPDTPRGRIHSIRSLKTETFAFFPSIWDVKVKNADSFMAGPPDFMPMVIETYQASSRGSPRDSDICQASPST
jgi:hypothetical protein